MKIPPDLYARIVEAMRKCPTMTKENVEAHRAYLAGLPRYHPGMVGNLPKRMRWDLLYATQACWDGTAAPSCASVGPFLQGSGVSKHYTITGDDAIRLAECENLTIHCYANPLDDGGPVTVGVARQIFKEDPSLVYVTVAPTGWRNAAGNHCDSGGRTVEAYFNRHTGEYLGPDDDGVEPSWNDAGIAS